MIGQPQGLARRHLLTLAVILAIVGGAAFVMGVGPFRARVAAEPAAETVAADLAADPAPAEEALLPAGENGRPGEAAPAEEPAARRLLVSTKRRVLFLVEGTDTLFRAPIAIGMGKDFEYNGRKYHFSTPTGQRRVIGKQRDPLWTVPEWHYFEKAAEQGLEAVRLDKDSRIMLGDSTFLEVRGSDVGRVNHFGYFHAWTPGSEIIFDGKIFIPPLQSNQRRVPEALGPFKLDMGDGYLIHGTHVYNEESIGQAVSHGCVRMRNEDITRLYPMVPVGTPVTIY